MTLLGAAIAATVSCQSGDDEIGEAVSPALVLDSGLNFYSFKCNDAPAFDPARDQSNASEHRDIVGNPTEDEAAIYFAADATRLYLRVRLDGDPRTNDPTNLKSFGWAFLFDTEERGDPEVPEYERLAHVNGTGGVDRISLFDNIDPVENDPADKSENENVVYGDVVDRWVVERACDSAAQTCFSGDDDFFLTWALEWSDLEDDQAPWITAAVIRSAAVVMTAGTTVSNNAIDADYVCFNNLAGFPPLDGIPNDPVSLSCGNDLLDTGEGCDDGNQDDGDGCTAFCLVEDGFPCDDDADCLSDECDDNNNVCGSQCDNGELEGTEGCDDGNQTPGDGCGATCLIESGIACNDNPAGLLGDDSCESGICDETEAGSGLCENANTCGNSVVEGDEQCDDGNNASGDGCSAGCVIEIVCGTGVLQANEGCDDNNTNDNDGCNSDCLIEDGSACNADPAGLLGSASCASNVCNTTGGDPGTCEPADTCGNSVLEAGEGCDDGNTATGDGCDDSCRIEDNNACNIDPEGVTGDGSCASGICDTTGGGAGVCEPANSCGNNVLETGEGCDDGNTAAGDGCDANCLIEDGGACNDDTAGNTGDTSCASGICDESEGGTGICEPSGCGNGILEAYEGCDDGNTTAGDGCAANCFIEDGESCNDDPAGQTGDGSCESGICDTSEGPAGVCEPAGCGNNLLEAGEGCDDGNTAAADGCTEACLLEDGESCNDDPAGQTGDESCDSGICDTTEGGSGVCEPAGCGNNLVEGVEGCDDGNTDNDDGCSAECLIEDGVACELDEDGNFDDSSCSSGSCDGSGTCNPPIGVSGGGCSSAGGQASSAGVLVLAALLWLLVAPVRRRRLMAGALIAAAVALSSTPRASAQEAIDQGFALERFRLSSHDGGFLNVEWGSVLGHLEWDGAFWLGASDDPLVVFLDEDGDRERLGSLVSHRVGATLMGSIGLYDRLQLTVELPMIMSQDEEQLAEVMPGLSGFGLGDLRVAPKLLIASVNGLHLAVVGSLTLPTGGGDAFRGDSNVTFSPEAVVSKQLGPWRMSGNLGYRLRENLDLPQLGVGDELFAHLGASYRFAERGGPPLETGLTLATGTRAGDPFGDFNSNQLELLGGASYRLNHKVTGVLAAGVGLEEGYGTPDWRAVLAIRFRKRPPRDSDGDGLVDNVDSCPQEPEDVDSFQDSDGCPDPDNDADKVADLEDGAPMDPEDHDGFEDTDGVPDPDNDGDGFADAQDQCPNEAETVNQIEDTDGCPDGDADGDKIADAKDECPQKPEDFDQFEDTDGCPDLDNDADGVVDAKDRCVNEPGIVENAGCPDTDRDGDTVVDRLDNCPDEPGPPENQGCKKKQLVRIQQNKIELLQVVYFRTNRATILRRSHALLDNVAAVLAAHEHVSRVRVEGHTDARGNDAYNKDLSARRAKAVVDYLVGKGITAARLEPVGLGEEQPIADNKTRKGRSQNRRVEFVIVESAGVAPAPAPATPTPAAPTEK